MAQVKVFSLGGIGSPCCCGGCTPTFCVTACGGAPVVGVAVKVYSGSTLEGQCTTDGTGCCAIAGLATGTYTVEVISGGMTIYSASRSVGCSNAICCSTICVQGCSQNIVGATVTISSGGTTVSSGTTGSGGCVPLLIGLAGTYTVAVTATGFQASSGSYVLTCNGTTTIGLTIDPAWTCACQPSGCAPMPTSLTGSDGIGSFALSYGTAPGGSTGWGGCASRSYTGCSLSDPLDASTISYGTVSLPVGFSFNCVGVNQYAVALLIPISTTFGGIPVRGLSCPASPWNLPANVSWTPILLSSYTITNLITCNPVDYSYSLPANSAGLNCNTSTGQCIPSIGIPPCNSGSGGQYGGCQIYGCGGMTLTVTP